MEHNGSDDVISTITGALFSIIGYTLNHVNLLNIDWKTLAGSIFEGGHVFILGFIGGIAGYLGKNVAIWFRRRKQNNDHA